MRFALPQLGLPLLTKELVEQAARKRTYIVRVVYASLLFLAGFAFYYQIANQYNGSAFAILGQGRQLFEQIIMVQFMGVYLFMPAMTCGVVTVEKERSSLGLLFLTRLGPWTILIEKFLGRIIPMFSFLLLSLPLLVIAYSLGGISQKYLWTGVWFLSLVTFQVGALALLCSSFFRTTVGAFMATYLLGLVMLIWLPMTDYVLGLDLVQLARTIFPSTGNPMLGWNSGGQWVPLMFVAPAIFEMTSRANAPLWEIAIASMPIIALTATMLILARVFVVRRAFLPAGNVFLKALKWLDAFFTKLNDNRWTKGRVLLASTTALNTITEPVAWRETTKTSLGAFRYLVRLFILMEAPIAFIGLLLISANGSHEPLTIMLLLLWIVVTLMVAVKAATLVAGERSHETLDVLLTTPLRSSEIVKQKFRGVVRLMWVLSVPLLTCIFLKVAIVQVGGGGYRNYGYGRGGDWFIYMVCAVLEVVIYLPMVAWLSLLIGMRVRSQSKAIFVTLATIVAWCSLPVFFFVMLFETIGWHRGISQCWLLTSPATIIPFNEFFDLQHFEVEWLAVILNFLLYTLILFVLRGVCLRNLDKRLGRASGYEV